MLDDTETTNIPSLLTGFNRYGLPGRVIAVLFLFLAGESYYGIKALINNTKAMTELSINLSEMRQELKACRDGR